MKIEHWAKQSDGVWNFKGSEKGVVTALYPHIFTVEVGGIRKAIGAVGVLNKIMKG